MNSTQKGQLLSIIGLIAREKHRKKLKSARNKRYYQKHKDEILQKNKLKNQLYKKFIENH
jgi:hypothetical protein